MLNLCRNFIASYWLIHVILLQIPDAVLVQIYCTADSYLDISLLLLAYNTLSLHGPFPCRFLKSSWCSLFWLSCVCYGFLRLLLVLCLMSHFFFFFFSDVFLGVCGIIGDVFFSSAFVVAFLSWLAIGWLQPMGSAGNANGCGYNTYPVKAVMSLHKVL